MSRKAKLQKLINVLKPDETKVTFDEFDSKVEELKNGLKEKIQVQTLDDVKTQLAKFQDKINLDPLVEAINKIEQGIEAKLTLLANAVDDENAKLFDLLQNQDTESKAKVSESQENLELLKLEIQSLNTQKSGELREVKSQIAELSKLNTQANKTIDELKVVIESSKGDVEVVRGDLQTITLNSSEAIEKLRGELTNRINSIPRGGGNANRNISIGGNASTLSRYTDINLKAGSNVTITYTNNDTTKNTDITISSSGGGGSSVAGMVRSINTIATSQTAGNTAGTDYVYLCTQGVALTLPAAAANTNLYTVKNVSNSSVLVVGTIDDDVNGIIMPVKYTSVDLISNDTDWKIT